MKTVDELLLDQAHEPDPKPVYDVVKRAFDLCVSLPAFIFLSPMMAIVALAIALDSPGPVLYKQRRVGLNGKIFGYFKFRTMRSPSPESDQLQKEHLSYITKDKGKTTDLDNRIFKLTSDPRITRIGRFLRKTSLDELPALINVLTGDVSLVGPRPRLPYEAYRGENFTRRLSVKPGVTGLSQIDITAISSEEKSQKDEEYIRKRSLLLDLKILVRTLGTVLSSKAAH